MFTPGLGPGNSALCTNARTYLHAYTLTRTGTHTNPSNASAYTNCIFYSATECNNICFVVSVGTTRRDIHSGCKRASTSERGCTEEKP